MSASVRRAVDEGTYDLPPRRNLVVKMAEEMRWAVWLIAIFIACQIIADITATKMVSLLGAVVPGGTFVYALTFTVSDFMQRKLGKKIADRAVVAAAVINIGMVLYFQLIIGAPWPPFWSGQEAFAVTLGTVWMIVGPSILAELIAGLLDNKLYSLVSQRPAIGMLLSNAISVPIDSIVFAGLAFGLLPLLTGMGHLMTVPELWQVVVGQVLFKWAVGGVIMPLMVFIRK